MVLKPIEVRKLLASFTVTCETTISSSLCSSRTETSTVSSPGCSFTQSYDKQMFFPVDDTCLPSEVPTSDLPASPCIIFCGDSLLTASRLMLSIDKVVVTEQLTNFVEALLMMFASYYCLNIHYPSELGATLEFLQRCIFKINPDKGTKVEQKPLKRQYAVNPRVLSLISAIADFEWRE
ncbi:hypothetical protein AOXY_G9688 [Acipenser oxyrinchus oxyrinchus]|uniref:Uncharacterized protein n=1 Tax=Acipenser oxyrinchus oxyrinchus TaxID=40147 RepID=A0AAD8G872_ACIOX|nr:hypothetical protein AOXY_G9688 [Acipenser oxyrinchus oxyrinchus]